MKFTNDQVSRLLIEKITGTIEPEDDLAIEQLLVYDEFVRNEWLRLKEKLRQAEQSGFTADADVEVYWQNLRSQLNIPGRRKIFTLPRVAAAAVIIVICVSAIYYWKPVEHSPALALRSMPDQDRVYLQNPSGEIAYADTGGVFNFDAVKITASKDALSYDGNGNAHSGLNILSVPRTMTYSITLSDGTRISMNSKTVLRFPFHFKGDTREVYLKGEAYFQVAKDKNHPFIVHAPGSDIKVLGTAFNLNTYDSTFTKTSLVEGSVLASSPTDVVRLEPGFEAFSQQGRKNLRVEKFDATEVLSWMKGRFYFHNASLQELSSLLIRWYKVRVIFNNASHRQKTFSGEIWKNQPVELFLDNLRLSNNVPLSYSNGVVLFQ